MITRTLLHLTRCASLNASRRCPQLSRECLQRTVVSSSKHQSLRQLPRPQSLSFHTSRILFAQSPTADALMENLNDLYATAKDEFEIAAEETEKKTVYAADDREAAREALTVLKEAFERASKESDPEVSKEVQGRVGPRIRELENAVIAMEESAMED